MEKEGEYSYLIEQTLLGSQEAYSELYDKTIEAVYKTAHFLIEEKSDVDDVVQEIYMQLYQSLSQFDWERSFRPWLIGLVVRQQEEMMKASMVIQPYFDKLNGEKSSKEVLTPEEFKQYIHASMTYEKYKPK